MKPGIVSYGAYIPVFRILLTEIAAAWQKQPEEITSSLGIKEKSVPGVDEDAVTLAIEAASEGLRTFSREREAIDALFVGSESHPYAVNPTSTIVGELLGLGNSYLAADLQFACKAATAGMQAISGMIASGQIAYGMAIGSDTAQSRPHDILEYTSASAAVAYILGKDSVIAELSFSTSYSSDTPDFWRRDGIRYPSHAGRFTGEPAYFTHVLGSSRALLEKSGLKPSDFTYCVFHMPNGKFPRDAAKRLGFTGDQLAPSLTVDHIGNPYSASSLLGLAATLDIARPGDTIFMASYGSGAGSDAFAWKVTDAIRTVQEQKKSAQRMVSDLIAKKSYVNYVEYLKKTHKI